MVERHLPNSALLRFRDQDALLNLPSACPLESVRSLSVEPSRARDLTKCYLLY